MARVLVATPTTGFVTADTHVALCSLDPAGHELEHFCVNGYGVGDARNEIARRAVEGGFDYVLMVDSDVVPPRDAIAMLSSHGEDLVTGYYVRGTSYDGLTNAVRLGGEWRDCHSERDFAEMRDGGASLVEVRGNGLGCAWMSRRLLGFVKHPRFVFTRFANGNGFGEDYYFCQRCREAGVRVYVDARVGCKHFPSVPMGVS